MERCSDRFCGAVARVRADDVQPLPVVEHTDASSGNQCRDDQHHVSGEHTDVSGGDECRDAAGRPPNARGTNFEAAFTGFKTFSKRKLLLESVSGLVKTIAKGAPKGFGTIAVMEIQFGLRAANTPVAFFSVADSDLLFASTAPHEKDAVLPEGISLVTTLLFDDESCTPSVALVVYSIAKGLQAVCYPGSAAHMAIVEFAVRALHRLQHGTSVFRTPFDIVGSAYFDGEHRLKVVSVKTICVAASAGDWKILQNRNVDFANKKQVL